MDRKVICCKCVNGGTDPFCGRGRLSHLSKHRLSLCKLKFVQSHAPTVAVSCLKARGDNAHLNIQISAAEAGHTARCLLRMPLAPILLHWVKGDASCWPFFTCGFLCGLLDWTAALQEPPQRRHYSPSAADRTLCATKRAHEPQPEVRVLDVRWFPTKGSWFLRCSAGLTDSMHTKYGSRSLSFVNENNSRHGHAAKKYLCLIKNLMLH